MKKKGTDTRLSVCSLAQIQNHLDEVEEDEENGNLVTSRLAIDSNEMFVHFPLALPFGIINEI